MCLDICTINIRVSIRVWGCILFKVTYIFENVLIEKHVRMCQNHIAIIAKSYQNHIKAQSKAYQNHIKTMTTVWGFP